MISTDWEDFINDHTWFVRKNDDVKILNEMRGQDYFILPDSFIDYYPCLSELLIISRVTNLEVNKVSYQLLGWTDHKGDSFGWVTKLPSIHINKPFCEEHKLLLRFFGGIAERWNEDDDSWLLNLSSALTEEESQQGFLWNESYIEDVCKEKGLIPFLDPHDYIAFAFEANGDLTLYNKNDLSVIMIAHDHCFDHIIPVEGYPEYTIYRIRDCPNFLVWVETIAKQGLHRISRKF